MSNAIKHLPLSAVVGASIDATAPAYGRDASGYGRKVPTRYRVTLDDGRARRVYVAALGNGGSAYVVRGGENVYITGDVERVIELMRDGADYATARDALARELAAHGLTSYDAHGEA
jgi:hypothetical protein